MTKQIIKKLATISPNEFDGYVQSLENIDWKKLCSYFADALQLTKSGSNAYLLSDALTSCFSRNYVSLIYQKILDPSLVDCRGGLIRSLEKFDCSEIVFGLCDLLIVDNYEQAYSTYLVLSGAEFNLIEEQKSKLDTLLSKIKKLAFCENKRQVNAAIGDIKKNLQIA